ncbi:glycosyltransferase [bacterium]|nr:glycosyltransferase [bacterium]
MTATRITYLIPTLDQSGAEKQLTWLATRLPREEFQPRVIALTRGGPFAAVLADADIPVTVIGKRWKCDPWAWQRLRQELRQHPPDILHTWLFAAHAYGRLALPPETPVKRVVSERCVDSWKAGWQLWVDRQLIPRTDVLIGNSPSVVEFYAQLGMPAERCHCIPNGVEPIAIDRSQRARLLASLGIPESAYVIVSIGRLAEQKRVRDLIWGAITLWQIRPQVHLLVIGDGPERTRLEEFAASVDAQSMVHFLGHRDDATKWLAAGDVFWLASSFEGLSNSLMEAMAAGLPVVATEIPPNRYLVTPDEQGFLVRVGDPVGLMQFTRCLIDEPGLAARLGTAGQVRMQTEFTIERMVERHVELYRHLRAS